MERIMRTLNKMIPKGITTRRIGDYLYLKGFQLRRMRYRHLHYYSEEFKETIIVEFKYVYTDELCMAMVKNVERSGVYDK